MNKIASGDLLWPWLVDDKVDFYIFKFEYIQISFVKISIDYPSVAMLKHDCRSLESVFNPDSGIDRDQKSDADCGSLFNVYCCYLFSCISVDLSMMSLQ